MIFELRRYRLQPGHMPSMHDRMKRHLFPLFKESGIPHPVGIWEATAGASLPMFVWMLRWDSFEQRQAAWNTFYPKWNRVRQGVNPGDEFVLNTSASLLSEWPELPWKNNADSSACDELWIRQVTATQSGLAKTAFLDGEAVALKEAGAIMVRAFDFAVGEVLPRVAMFVSWPDAQTREDGMAAYESSPIVSEQYEKAAAAFGRPLIESTDRILLRPADYLS
jgi:hypothetical protein